MGIQINGQTDTVTAIDGSINIGGNVTVPGVLTYDDVTNIDSVGVITARDGIRVTGGVVDIGTETSGRKTLTLNSSDNGSAVVFRADAATRARIEVPDGQTDLIFGVETAVTPSERLRITSGGNIGIGTDNPTESKIVIGHTQTSTVKHLAIKDLTNNWVRKLGIDSSNNFGIFSGDTEHLRIDSSGRVTTPNQPCFWAISTSGSANTANGYTGIISNQFENAYTNVGGHYNTSTGVFTCPVAGVYQFHGQALLRYGGAAGHGELTFHKNGVNTVPRSHGYTYMTATGDHDNLHVMRYMVCAANDQIDFRVHAMAAGCNFYYHEGLGYFAGRLVG